MAGPTHQRETVSYDHAQYVMQVKAVSIVEDKTFDNAATLEALINAIELSLDEK